MSGRRLRASALMAAVVAVAVAVAAGCGSSSDRALRTSLDALSTPPPRAAAATPPGAPVRCGNPTASLRPVGAPPPPGRMPAGSYMARILRRGRLIAGVDQNTLLFAYFNPTTRRIEGFEVDVLRELARAIFGNPDAIELKAVTTAERIPLVQSGAVDVVADAVTVNCQRRRLVDFSSVYFAAAQRVLVPAGSHVRGLRDLRGRRVCATRSSTSLARLEHAPSHPKPYPVAQRTDCLVALQEGRVAAITSDDAILLGFKAQDPATKIVGPPLGREPYGMAIAKGHPEFVRFVNGVLDRMRGDGSWAAIHRRWLGPFAATPAPPKPRYTR
jgi:polar amino acid transport system substrate-binding protein